MERGAELACSLEQGRRNFRQSIMLRSRGTPVCLAGCAVLCVRWKVRTA
jgi:hypothetical protein